MKKLFKSTVATFFLGTAFVFAQEPAPAVAVPTQPTTQASEAPAPEPGQQGAAATVAEAPVQEPIPTASEPQPVATEVAPAQTEAAPVAEAPADAVPAKRTINAEITTVPVFARANLAFPFFSDSVNIVPPFLSLPNSSKAVMTAAVSAEISTA